MQEREKMDVISAIGLLDQGTTHPTSYHLNLQSVIISQYLGQSTETKGNPFLFHRAWCLSTKYLRLKPLTILGCVLNKSHIPNVA